MCRQICLLNFSQPHFFSDSHKLINYLNHKKKFITNIGSSLRRVKALVQCRRSKIIKNLLNPSSSDAIFRTSYDSSVSPIVQDNSDCNEVQREVVKDAASIVTHKDSKFCFVQGPPGTGKTKTIINIIKIIAYVILKYNVITGHDGPPKMRF